MPDLFWQFSKYNHVPPIKYTTHKNLTACQICSGKHPCYVQHLPSNSLIIVTDLQHERRSILIWLVVANYAICPQDFHNKMEAIQEFSMILPICGQYKVTFTQKIRNFSSFSFQPAVSLPIFCSIHYCPGFASSIMLKVPSSVLGQSSIPWGF